MLKKCANDCTSPRGAQIEALYALQESRKEGANPIVYFITIFKKKPFREKIFGLS